MWEDPWAQLKKEAAKRQQQQKTQLPEDKPAGSTVIADNSSLADVLRDAMQVCFLGSMTQS